MSKQAPCPFKSPIFLSFALVFFSLFSSTFDSPAHSQAPVCGNYDGCDPVILKVRGVVRGIGGLPLTGVTVVGTENRRRDVGAVEFFSHCGQGLHIASLIQSSTSQSASVSEPGTYELLFIVCAEDKGDFAADFDICVSTPGYADACITATFDGDDDREEIDFDLVPTGKETPEGTDQPKGLPAGPCGDYSDCSMVLLKVRGFVTALADGTPITNAQVTGVVTQNNDVNSIQFYTHCGDGTHSLKVEEISTSTSSSSIQAGFYELLFSVCAEDNNDVLPDEFDLDVEVRVTAPGFEEQTIAASFDEEDDRDDRDFALVAIALPTETFTPVPTETETPTATTVMTLAPTALNPNADVDGSGQVDHLDLLEVLNNWYRIVP